MRKNGFYFVKYDEEWRIGEYFQMADNWFLTGEANPFNSSELEEIDERQIVREEPEKRMI